MDKMTGLTPILINFVVTFISIVAAYRISKHTIDTNRRLNKENTKINAENAGKNRIIYGTEQIDIRYDNNTDRNRINERLNSGSYTILTAFVDLSNHSQTRFVLGKIKP